MPTMSGAFTIGFLITNAIFSARDMMMGGMNMAGAAMMILDGTT
jgi:hypothetical protein